MKKSILSAITILLGLYGYSQGLISQTTLTGNGMPGCGSYDLLKQDNGFQKASDDLARNLQLIVAEKKSQKTESAVLTIQVVFHIVHNNSEENIPNSVIYNQLEILNECYRRQNEDTINTRTEFQSIVGDSRIEFELASSDPNGNPTNGITRTLTEVAHFGDTLPYSSGQNQEITNWVNDSLFNNLFRIADASAGGKNAWNPNKYLNIWIGDLRIFEPNFNNFEELIFYGLATPPVDHPNWPDTSLSFLVQLGQGVLLHYVNVGANNPNLFPAPYTNYNGLVTTGKVLVHETGHYLGLRHIWGDGDCSEDDYIGDTPRSNNPSNYVCNPFQNRCTDTINGLDLPDMIENYMDYSNGDCQNSFTVGQIEVMKATLETYRSELLEVEPIGSSVKNNIKLYPNPSSGEFSVQSENNIDELIIHNLLGEVVYSEMNPPALISTSLPSGLYFVTLSQADKYGTLRWLVD